MKTSTIRYEGVVKLHHPGRGRRLDLLVDNDVELDPGLGLGLEVVRVECMRCPWLLAQTKVATILGIFLAAKQALHIEI